MYGERKFTYTLVYESELDSSVLVYCSVQDMVLNHRVHQNLGVF
jgi:hypothetical protein